VLRTVHASIPVVHSVNHALSTTAVAAVLTSSACR